MPATTPNLARIVPLSEIKPLAILALQEEIGDVVGMDDTVRRFASLVAQRGDTAEITAFRGFAQRLAGYREHEQVNGVGSLLKEDHPFVVRVRAMKRSAGV